MAGGLRQRREFVKGNTCCTRAGRSGPMRQLFGGSEQTIAMDRGAGAAGIADGVDAADPLVDEDGNTGRPPRSNCTRMSRLTRR